MAERGRNRDRYQVRLYYSFDRLFGSKLQQVYELLVPDQVRIIGERSGVMEGSNADRGDLCTGVVGQATGGGHDRQSDGSVDRVRTEPRISSPDGLGLRRRRL